MTLLARDSLITIFITRLDLHNPTSPGLTVPASLTTSPPIVIWSPRPARGLTQRFYLPKTGDQKTRNISTDNEISQHVLYNNWPTFTNNVLRRTTEHKSFDFLCRYLSSGVQRWVMGEILGSSVAWETGRCLHRDHTHFISTASWPGMKAMFDNVCRCFALYGRCTY